MQTSPTIQSNFQALVDLLVSTNHERRRTIDPLIEQALSPAQYLREFCTVHVNIGRCTGKTHYIQSRYDQGDFVVVANLHTKRYYQEEGYDNIGVWGMPTRGFLPNKKMNAVYVDEPNLCFINEVELSRFYDVAASYNAHTIVMLGE
jgi:hypothetical protein